MEPEKKSNGALIGLVIIIIILMAGGIYMWQANKNSRDSMEETQLQEQGVTNQDSEQLNTLETDIQNTDTSTGVDANTIY